MLISVGGTPAPLITSINEYNPDFISFLVSQLTLCKISEIKKEINQNINTEVTVVDNPDELLHCHIKAEEAVGRVLKRSYAPNDVVVDYTGGTKNISVALSLAAISYGFMFSYVGGTERTKDGVGIVKNGSEQIYSCINPWDFLAIGEKRKVSLLFNTYQFKAARSLINALLEKHTKFQAFFRTLGFIIDGYYLWDLFRHEQAQDAFRKAKIEDLLCSDDKKIVRFAADVLLSVKFLEKFPEKSGTQGTIFKELILDLFSNAQRRNEEGKRDDAILRIYRIVEMLAQERLQNRYGINTSQVNVEQVPEELREEYKEKYSDGRTMKVPQAASLYLLKSLGDDLGKIFFKKEAEFKKIQNVRNNSYLAHGFKSAKENTYPKLKEFVLGLNIFKEEEAPVYPKLHF
ncbi:MAG: TIGR02710 family CRISPR-associated CARF protein [bacterium]